MALRKKLTLVYDEIPEEEAAREVIIDRDFPFDTMQKWAEEILQDQQEAQRNWINVGRMVVNERRRSTIMKKKTQGLLTALAEYRKDKRILKRSQQEQLNQLKQQALEIINPTSPTVDPLGIEPSSPPTLPPTLLAITQGEEETIIAQPAPTRIPTPAARKEYKIQEPDSSGSENRLYIDEDHVPEKKKKRSRSKNTGAKRERKTSGTSHHSSQQGRIGGRFSKKIKTDLSPPSPTKVNPVDQQEAGPSGVNIKLLPQSGIELKELAVIIPKVSLPKCNFLLHLKLEPS